MKTNFLLKLIIGLTILSFIILSCSKKKRIYYQWKIVKAHRQQDTDSRNMRKRLSEMFEKINDSVIEIKTKSDTIAESNSEDTAPFYNMHISKKTIIVRLGKNKNDNDTLRYEAVKKFNNRNVYSFYYHFKGYDGDYRLYLCDSIGEVAFYSTTWRNLSVLNKIINDDAFNSKWQAVKAKLMADTTYFPVPLNLYPERKLKFIAPVSDK